MSKITSSRSLRSELSSMRSANSTELSRVSSSNSVSSTSSSVLQKWCNDTHTPLQLLKLYPLPQLVKVVEDTCPGTVDLKVPLLLYKVYKTTKIQARSLKKVSVDRYEEVGPIVVIPDNYTGWFALLPESGHTAPCYRNVGEVAAARPPYFLVKDDVTGYMLVQNKEAQEKPLYLKTVIKSGHVLKLLGVFEDIGSKKNKPNKSSKYIQCVNYKGEVLYLPFASAGLFYSVATRGCGRSPDHVYLMSHILRYFRLPVRVRLVCGFLPKVPCHFTGFLKLEGSRKEDVILSCTVGGNKPTMLEVDIRSNFSLCRAVVNSTSLFSRSRTLLASLLMCREEGEVWRRQMKVVQHVFPEADTSSIGSSGHRSQKQQTNKKKQETQSVSIAIVFDDLAEESSARKRLERLVEGNQTKNNSYRGGRRHPDSRQIKSSNPTSTPSTLSRSLSKSTEDLPYCRVVDELCNRDDDEDNIYAEICEERPYSNVQKSPGGYYLKLPGFEVAGGSDGTFSSNASSPEEDSNYDSFC